MSDARLIIGDTRKVLATLGIDLDSRNAELAAARVGLFLTVEDAA